MVLLFFWVWWYAMASIDVWLKFEPISLTYASSSWLLPVSRDLSRLERFSVGVRAEAA